MLSIKFLGLLLENDDLVQAKIVEIMYYPPPRMGPFQDVFVKFEITWNSGKNHRDNFLVKLGQVDGVLRYKLVFENPNDPENSRVGLQQPVMDWITIPQVLWAQQDIEPRDWLH